MDVYLCVLTPKHVADKALLVGAFFCRQLEECEVLRQEIEALKSQVGSEGCVKSLGRDVGADQLGDES